MTIEITKGSDNPVAEFFSSPSNTPETDHLEGQLGSAARLSHPIIWKHARQLERERDEAREKYDTLAVENMLEVNKLCKERDEAKSISDDLAIIASHCLGWHDHESSDTKIKIAAALKRWKKSKLSNEQD